MSIESWLTFLAVFTLLSLPIGPNAVCTMTAAITNGLPKGFLVPIGIGIASVIHALVASLGFGALLLASAELFTAFKWLGAVYLLWLGVKLWRSDPTRPSHNQTKGSPAVRLIMRGCLVSLCNPKAVLSYLAIFPQFIVASEPVGPQLAVLMPTATVIVILVYSAEAVLAFPARILLKSPRRMRIFNRTTASFYILSAGVLALAGRK